MSDTRIEVAEVIDPEIADALWQGLSDHAADHDISLKARDVQCVSRDADGAIVAGLTGNTLGGYFYIARLWTASSHRNTGIGRALMEAAENIARERGCHTVYLNTFDFQARTYYEGLDYVVFAALRDHDPRLCRYFMKKTIGATPA
ncbi:MAG: GNAT family N-acetyltransferase [Phycisphaera sp.]|nr:GNAT family N-acetyltransferase [Phycisphaera sp.]